MIWIRMKLNDLDWNFISILDEIYRILISMFGCVIKRLKIPLFSFSIAMCNAVF